MLKSLYLRRTLLLILVSVLLSASLTALLYGVVARYSFSRIKTGEMVDISMSVEEAMKGYLSGNVPASYVERLLAAHTQVYGTYIVVYDYNADIKFSVLSDEETGPVEPLSAALSEDIQSILRGDGIVYPRIRDYSQFVIVGRPITVGPTIYGAVVLLMPMSEVTTLLSGLVRTLLFSSLFVILVMLVPAYVMSRRFVKPLREIKNVASAMSDGDFSVRAGKKYSGEFAELASSFDHLAEGLSRTISELSLERTRLRQTVDGLMEGIVAVDAHCRVTHANPAVRAIFDDGANAQDLPERDLIPDEKVWAVFRQVISRNLPLSGDIGHNGKTIRYTVTPLGGEQEDAAGAVGLFRDVTEAQRLEQTRRDYVANVSHELRTPLTAMRALVEPLADNMVASDEDRGRYYSMLLSEIRRLTRLINDMLELSRLQAGSVAMEMAPVGLHDLLQGISDKYAAVAEESGLEFHSIFDSGTDCQVFINRDRVEQILVILLDNAVKYTGSGGRVSLDARQEEGHVLVMVSDTGDGISQEDLPHVFERFYKADKARRPASGTGLGLSIAREILEAMHETIQVQSSPDAGSTFSFTLPLHDTLEDGNE